MHDEYDNEKSWINLKQYFHLHMYPYVLDKYYICLKSQRMTMHTDYINAQLPLHPTQLMMMIP